MGHSSLKMKHYANDGKLNELRDLLFAYRPLVNDIATEQMNQFISGQNIAAHMADPRYKKFNSVISARYAQTAYRQAKGMCDSYIESMVIRIRKAVHVAGLPDDFKHQLNAINKNKAWFKPDFTYKDLVLTDAAREFARQLFNFYDTDSRFNCDEINMMLGANVAPFEIKDSKKARHFDYWLKISSLKRRKKINIPLMSNRYFQEYEGKLKDAVQVNYKNGEFQFVFLREFEDAELRLVNNTLALDVGMKYLFATPHGDLLGVKYHKHLDEMQERIDKLQKALVAQKLKPSENKRYKDMVRKRRAYMKNEINRIFNKLIKLYHPDQILVEKLDFRGGKKLYKKTKVRIHNYGKEFINEKLKRLREKKGIGTQLVRAEYTSQLCHKCGKLEKTNRKGIEYRCSCGCKCHADVNAARNISARSSWGAKMKKEEIRRELLAKYAMREGLTETVPAQEGISRSGCTHSSANHLSRSTDKSTSHKECGQNGKGKPRT